LSIWWDKQHPPVGMNGEAWGWDGDCLHGAVKVNYWADRDAVMSAIESINRGDYV